MGSRTGGLVLFFVAAAVCVVALAMLLVVRSLSIRHKALPRLTLHDGLYLEWQTVQAQPADPGRESRVATGKRLRSAPARRRASSKDG